MPAPSPVPDTPLTDNGFTCLDLFCGCGGFSLGMIRAGFRVLAAIDFNKEAVETAARNLGAATTGGETRHIDNPIPHVLMKDLTTYQPAELAELIGRETVDAIVGGPPCQGFSSARQRDGANHGTRRLIEDSRRYLYQDFLRFVKHFRPSIFVMENVLGIRSAAGGQYYTRVMDEARKLGYRVQSQIEEAQRLGVPQKRRRQLFIGVLQDRPLYFPREIKPASRAHPGTLLGQAIMDLPPLSAGEGDHETRYDLRRREKHLERSAEARNYLLNVLEIDKAGDTLTSHVARPHNAIDIKCFKSLKEGESSATVLRRNPATWFPYNRENFKDRYTRQSRRGACSTIVAHLSKDGLMFIHPTQDRSLTPREAARIQSFPDWFQFPEARTHAFRLIGNAVPPLVAEAVGIALRRCIREATPDKIEEDGEMVTFKVPKDEISAARHLEQIIDLTPKELKTLTKEQAIDAWAALFFIFPFLHPDERDHGDEMYDENPTPDYYLVHKIDERLMMPAFVRSGWPKNLVPLLDEMFRRLRLGLISEDEYYLVEAQQAGIKWREENLHAQAAGS